ARLNGSHLLRLPNVGDIENPNAAKTLATDGRLHALSSAVDPTARLFDGHEQQLAVDGDVALPARTYDGDQHPHFFRNFDTVSIESVETPHDEVIPRKRQIRVCEV